MNLAQNLQFYRQKKDLTQEQLAEQLGVSRQSVSKWESGQSYPEMEKLLALCELFGCSLDTLMSKSAQEATNDVAAAYDAYRNRSARMTTIGVTLLILSVAAAALMDGLHLHPALTPVVFFSIAIVGVLVLIISGMLSSEFARLHPHVENCYTPAQRQAFHPTFVVLTVTGLGIIFLGILMMITLEALPLSAFWDSSLSGALFFVFIAAGVACIIWSGIQQNKFDIEAYNHENYTDEEVQAAQEKIGRICGALMLLATLVYVTLGLLYPSMWGRAWVAFPIAGIGCGIVSVLLKSKKAK